MAGISRAMLMGCPIDMVNMQQAVRKIKDLIIAGIPSQVITLNAEIVYLAQKDDDLRNVIGSASMVTPDGIGVVWGGRYCGYHIEERVTGIDLLHHVCSMCAREGYGLYLLGAAPGIAAQAAVNLVDSYPRLRICGSRDGYFSPEETGTVIDEIRQARPQVLLAALGAPKQEYWIHKYKEQLGVPVSIGVGGSFDVIAGTKKRAPGFIIKLNLEWLYRLVQEPARVKRQLVLPRFVWAVIRHGRSKDKL